MTRKKPRPADNPKVGERTLLKWYDEAKSNANEAARKHATKNEYVAALAKEITRAVQRRQSGEEPAIKKSKGGRTPSLDLVGLRALKAIAKQTAVERRFVQPKIEECKKMLHDERRRMLVRLRRASSAELVDMKLFPIDEKTEMKWINSIWPEEEKANYVAEHRDAVKKEIRNNIACCAVTDFVFSSTNPDCICTSDHFAVYRDSSGEIQVVRMAAGTGKEMRKEGWSVGHGGSNEAAANVKLPVHASMTMSKKVVSLISEVWDDQLVEPFEDGSLVKIFPLDATDNDPLSAECYTALIVHGTPHEVVMWHMYKDVIMPRMKRIRDKAVEMARQLRCDDSIAVESISAHRSASRSASNAAATAAPATPNPAARSFNSVPSAAPNAIRLPPSPGPGLVPASALPSSETDPVSDPSNLRGSFTSRRAASGGDSDAAHENIMLRGSWVGKPEEFDIVLCLDGDSASIQAITSEAKMKCHKDRKHPNGRLSLLQMIDKYTEKWGTIRFLKWAAGCTPMQSPNDAGKTHCIARRHIKGTAKKVVEAVPLNECCVTMQRFHARLQLTNIKPARKAAFWRLISNLPNAAAAAFQPKVIKSSWEKAGFMPFSALAILSKCSLWDCTGPGKLTDAQKRDILARYNLLFPSVQAFGRAPDLKQNELFPFLPPVVDSKHALEDLSLNRDRTALFSHREYFTGRIQESAAAHAANPDLRKPKQAKEPERVEWAEYPLQEMWAGKCSIDYIKMQLKIRGISWGRTTAKRNFLQLWKTNSRIRPVAAYGGPAAARVAAVQAPDAAAPVAAAPVAAAPVNSRPSARGGGGDPLDRIPGVPATPSNRVASSKTSKSRGKKRRANDDDVLLSDDQLSDASPKSTQKKQKTKAQAQPLSIPSDWCDAEQLQKLRRNE
jgi:hypothetical protein